ncbi:MAG: aquaporin family protein [Hyphomonadaceae bacterium]|nr:aquaporin family protein [Hyphomonadaceae bacterium]
MSDLPRRLAAELLGSCMLAGVVIGSGVMAARLSNGNDAVALLANAGATAAMLFVLITALAPISGAHFNPVVTLVMTLRRAIRPLDGAFYVIVQICGCVLGAMLAHAMFGLPLLQVGSTARSGLSQVFSEGVASFALVAVILLVSKVRESAIPAAVALTIAAGYWWTASTSFANPAITVARAFSDTFAGIRPDDAPAFVIAQLAGALLAWRCCAFLVGGAGFSQAKR